MKREKAIVFYDFSTYFPFIDLGFSFLGQIFPFQLTFSFSSLSLFSSFFPFLPHKS